MKRNLDSLRNMFPSADEPEGPEDRLPAPLLMAGNINAGVGESQGITEFQEGVIRIIQDTGIPYEPEGEVT